MTVIPSFKRPAGSAGQSPSQTSLLHSFAGCIFQAILLEQIE
jgi:hypothetical protein